MYICGQRVLVAVGAAELLARHAYAAVGSLANLDGAFDRANVEFAVLAVVHVYLHSKSRNIIAAYYFIYLSEVVHEPDGAILESVELEGLAIDVARLFHEFLV